MPLGRYFVFVGSALLALLFFADHYMPVKIAPPARADVDRSIIRIHSGHKWPDAVVFDTSFPTIVPAVVAADVAVEMPTREAFAQLPMATPAARMQVAGRVPKPSAVKRSVKARATVRRIANYQPAEAHGDTR